MYDQTGAQSDTLLLAMSAYSVGITILAVVAMAGLWGIFAKAGRPGWMAILPIYNVYVELEIVGRPWWWLLLYLVPGVNMVIQIIVAIDLARVFGKGAVFALGLILLPFIFYPLLGFGPDPYRGPGLAIA